MLTRLVNVKHIYTSSPKGNFHYQDATLVWDLDKIIWVGKACDLPKEYQVGETWDLGDRIVVPGLIDCHTHLAFGGWRAEEFEQKIQGKTYLEIAKEGGGILSTVNKTRKASENDLLEKCMRFVKEMVSLGVTTIECKSGYGLNLEDELKQLRVYRKLGTQMPVDVVSTLLAAHTVPQEWKDNRGEYVDLICNEIIPQVAQEKLAVFCDVYQESGAFSTEETRLVFDAAKKHGLKLKLHADQFHDNGGATLAAEYGAVSADHLEYASKEGLDHMAKKGVVAVLLPLASFYTRQHFLEANKLRESGVTVALATDFNPGSSPSYHLPLVMLLGCVMHKLSPEEVLRGVTWNAARAIGVEKQIGSLEIGKQADFAVIDAPDLTHWIYHFRSNACVMTVKKGQKIFS